MKVTVNKFPNQRKWRNCIDTFHAQKMGRKFLVFVGDCSLAGEVLAKKPTTPLWMIIGFFDILLRSYGQVVFCNNPVTGLLVLIALLISDPFAAMVGVIATTIAIFSAWLIDQPEDAIRGGVLSYNALLVGHLSAVLLPQMTVLDWIFMSVGSVFSVYFTSAFGTLFGSISKHPMPVLTVPFNLAQILVYLCAVSPGALYLKERTELTTNNSTQYITGVSNNSTSAIFSDSLMTTIDASSMEINWTTESLLPDILTVSGSELNAINITSTSSNITTIDTLDWGEVFTGALKSMGQMYGQEHLAGSLLMYVGVIISSPTTALMELFGSIIGTLMGALLLPSSTGALYSGGWGFNGALTAGALGGFALVLTPQSAALALLGSALTGVVQFALLSSFDRAGLPLMSLPFNLTTLLLLSTTASGAGSLVRPPAITYPEKHRRDWAAAAQIAKRAMLNQRHTSENQEDETDKNEKYKQFESV